MAAVVVGVIGLIVGLTAMAGCHTDETPAPQSASTPVPLLREQQPGMPAPPAPAAAPTPSLATPAPTASSSAGNPSGGAPCDGSGPNDASPEFYQEQYSGGLAKDLKRKLSAYDVAVETGDPQQIGQTAGDLYSTIESDADMATKHQLFGCYDPLVLTSLKQSTNVFATTLDDLACAGASTCGHTAAEVPGLVAQAKPQKTTYVEAINAYASQFGGEQIPQP